MPQVSVATWNLHHGADRRRTSMERTWGYLRDEIRPTVALVQESDGIPPTPGGHVLSRPDNEPRVRFETAVVGYEGQVEPLTDVVSKYSKGKSLSIRPTFPLTQVAAQVKAPGIEPFVAVSLYGRIDTYAQTSILRALADLIPLFDAPLFKRRIIVGGDLNVFNNGPRVDRVSRERWAAIFEVFRSLGLVNLLEKRRQEARRAGRPPLSGCLCGMGDACYHVETWQWNHTPGVWCLDYLFVTKELEERLAGPVEVWGETHPVVWEISDHCPLVARFDL